MSIYANLSREELLKLVEEQSAREAKEKAERELAAKFEGISINDKGNLVVKVSAAGYPFGGSIKKFISFASKANTVLEYIRHNWDSFKVGKTEGCSFESQEQKDSTWKYLLSVQRQTGKES
jgi:hypothetical protein